MELFYADHFVLPLPPGHRFPMAKYRLLRERLLTSGRFAAGDFRVPPAATDGQLARAHAPDYIHRVITGGLSATEQREIGLPWSEAMVERSRRSSGATLAAARAAMRHGGCAVNLAGGTHHAATDHGSGFCVFNDAAVAARALQAEDGVGHIAIVDCDVHQGDGTASILQDDAAIFTFSIHAEKNFPVRKQRSDLDIGLPDDTGDEAYLTALAGGLAQVFNRARPELVIYLAGADPFVGDRLGRLALSKAGLLARDHMVLTRCREAGIPVAIAMAGGYADRIEDVVDIHAATVLLAASLFAEAAC
ncbi:MAG: histone deacetylase [Candidatus Dactylopiibacterium carminicum]|uniref:Histone deacetylase n=1 Tax=Candidatus Dactylopiibacterium carminicum TaxID=857335 RepID=A0A272EP13_9RHOO|nr:histone deacetylase [Candidatus Dactylopiibacterium carminicum]KAF7599539.1 histone deacetylase [Candidatus Dactylopiibacterium carminicum]PAS91776.1 MAG: histone deacetylase [Candidatus Dactylopiibacterium carminicum]PAS92671.1 MAG: histone deacetylase [Candidatus Dactylopiibacterium carminicum]PAS99544.1 MAG: histone deacetylase [Candidatus Dactylopiibacterium carminicum]